VSEEALGVAARNAEKNGADVSFRQQDVLMAVPGDARYEVIVSNPPYIAEQEKSGMDANVLEWEPSLALFVSDDDPLVFYRTIALLAKDMLVEDGLLYFEINQAYGQETMQMLEKLGYTSVELRKDGWGNDRMIKAKRP
jgi:release factor glutamine methyltransferase